MTVRRKLLVAFALTVVISVAVVAWYVSFRTREAFQRASDERTAAFMAQFQREFGRRGDEVGQRIDTIAKSDQLARIAVELGSGGDPGAYVTEATRLAEVHKLDFLQLIGVDGTIISSAQNPGRFGYKESLPRTQFQPFLRSEEAPGERALCLCAVRTVEVGSGPIYVVGGEKLDHHFLASLTLPPGMRTMLYRSDGAFAPQNVVDAKGTVPNAEKLAPAINLVQQRATDVDTLVYWGADAASSEQIRAMPLKDVDGSVAGVLIAASSRREMVQTTRQIKAVALVAAGLGLLVAVVLSSWFAMRVSRPVEALADAARQVTAGNWNAHVDVSSRDEIGELARTFNEMTTELRDQRERLVQTERVAAWRELARRLAHELKNPLFPLQITIENLVRARELPPEEFDEIFQESTSTLLAELNNLKTIIGRFSDFSKMPKPQLQDVNTNEIAKQIAKLHEAQFKTAAHPVTVELKLDGSVGEVAADPDLLHRALSNLVLNAADAMPEGGTATIATHDGRERVIVEVSDTGTGLTREECDRLFTPYYTTKKHGTGLGLAIVQSVIADHNGSISVESTPGNGTTFRIELPKRQRQAADVEMFRTAGKIS